VRLDPVTGAGADVDVEVEDADGKSLGWGRRASGPEEVEVDGGVLYIRVHYWNGKADLFEYKLKVEGRP
jgi:hypothetical protein